jgi:hypothetical protein
MSNVFRNNGLSLVLAVLFLGLLWGQAVAGLHEYNEDQAAHGEPAIGMGEYLRSGHFIEATAENWESEFLQMAAYVLLTIGLFQKGSSESKDPDKQEAVDRDPRESRRRKSVPGPVRKGGLALWVYERSLSLAFILLFLVSIALHAWGGAMLHNEERVEHGELPVSIAEYVGSSKFWFESFQNWQSEFLALLAMVVLSIFLRQRGSPESKPVDAPHGETGAG